MANTKQSAKRARQAVRRNKVNTLNRATTKTAIRKALEAVQGKDLEKAKEAYASAIRALSKAASKGAIPARRASRKISRITHLVKKALPSALGGAAK